MLQMAKNQQPLKALTLDWRGGLCQLLGELLDHHPPGSHGNRRVKQRHILSLHDRHNHIEYTS